MAETQQQFADDLAGIAPKSPVQERSIVPAEDLRRYTPTGEAIPLDEDTGAPFSTRFRMSLVNDEATKKAIAQDAFAGARIEAVHPRTKLGDTKFVIRDFKDPQTGQVKDMLVDEKNATLKDLADMGEVGVQILGAYMALRGGKAAGMEKLAPGLVRTGVEALVGGAGGSALGGAVEGQERYSFGQDIKPGEILTQRTQEALTSAATGLGLGAVVGTGAKLANLRRGFSLTDESAAAIAARNRLAEETGVDVAFSLGEATGSQALREREQLLRKHILGGGRLGRDKSAQEASSKELGGEIPGTFGVPSDQLPSKDVVGTQAVSALRSIARGAEAGTVQARDTAMNEALTDLSTALDASTGMRGQEVLASEAGKASRTFMGLKKEAFDKIADQLNENVVQAAGTEAFIPSSLARKNIAPLVKSITRPETGELFEYVPPKVRAFLSDINALPAKRGTGSLADIPEDVGVGPAHTVPSKGLITLGELRSLRTGVNDAINESEILGTAETGKLKQISKALTQTLEEGIAHAPNPTAKQALENFNKFYRENIPGFQVEGITDILADPTQRKLGPFKIFKQAADDPDQYFRLKDALTKPLTQDGQAVGPASGPQTWNIFKQAMLTRMANDSAKSANRDLLDPTKLYNKLFALDTEVRNDLLGPQSDVVIRSLKRLEVLDDPKLPAAEALNILRQGGDTAPAQIMQLALREQELDKLYANQVVKKFVKGEIGSEQINSDQFVDRFATAGPISDVRDAMNKLELANPGMTKLVRSKMAQSILESSEMSGKKLAKEIGSQEMQDRLKVVLGEPGLRRLNDVQTVLSYLQQKGETEGMSIAGNQAKSNTLTILRAIRTLPAQLQYRVAALVISSPNVYRVATGPVQPLDPSKLIRAIVTSEDAIKELGVETVQTILGSIGGSTKRQPTQAEFEQQLRAK